MTRAPFDPVEAAHVYLIANGYPEADREAIVRLRDACPSWSVIARYSRKRQTEFLVSAYRTSVKRGDA